MASLFSLPRGQENPSSIEMTFAEKKATIKVLQLKKMS